MALSMPKQRTYLTLLLCVVLTPICQAQRYGFDGRSIEPDWSRTQQAAGTWTVTFERHSDSLSLVATGVARACIADGCGDSTIVGPHVVFFLPDSLNYIFGPAQRTGSWWVAGVVWSDDSLRLGSRSGRADAGDMRLVCVFGEEMISGRWWQSYLGGTEGYEGTVVFRRRWVHELGPPDPIPGPRRR